MFGVLLGLCAFIARLHPSSLPPLCSSSCPAPTPTSTRLAPRHCALQCLRPRSAVVGGAQANQDIDFFDFSLPPLGATGQEGLPAGEPRVRTLTLQVGSRRERQPDGRASRLHRRRACSDVAR